jgi:hypothetical protein
MKTTKQTKQEAGAALERGKAYDEGKCSFCGLPKDLTRDGLISIGNEKWICGKCINRPEIVERLKRDNETLYNDKIIEYCQSHSEFGNELQKEIDKLGDDVYHNGNAKWLTNLTIDELRTRAKEYVKPKLPEPVIINNIPIHKNQSTELLEGEAFKKHNKRNVEVSNLGRVKYGDCILEQYDPQNNGYLFVDIKTEKKTTPVKVYRLVAETWLEIPDLKGLPKVHKCFRYNTVHHISNNGYDNRIENLMWVTEWQHAMIHPWISINTFDYLELWGLFTSYSDINIMPADYQRIINITKRMKQLESPGNNYYYDSIIKAMEDLIRKNAN